MPPPDADPGYIYPEAYETCANAAMARAFWLSQCAHAAMYEAVHGAPEGMAPEKLGQRRMLLELAKDIFTAAARREMRLGIANWQAAEKLGS